MLWHSDSTAFILCLKSIRDCSQILCSPVISAACSIVMLSKIYFNLLIFLLSMRIIYQFLWIAIRKCFSDSSNYCSTKSFKIFWSNSLDALEFYNQFRQNEYYSYSSRGLIFLLAIPRHIFAEISFKFRLRFLLRSFALWYSKMKQNVQ